jgi:hypothetical protein
MDVSRRISAAALRNRGLVTVSGSRKTWAAAITAAGEEYLQRVDGANPPVPRQPNVSVTQQLVDEVVKAGGSLRVPRKLWHDNREVDYERRARLAEAHGKLPRGSRFVVTIASPTELLIELRVDPHAKVGGDDGSPGSAPLPVPARLTK